MEVLVSTIKLILVLRILYLYYEVYPGFTELILVLQNLFLFYRSYAYVTELILVFQILFLYEGTRRYDKSERIKLIQIHIRYGH